MPIRQRFRQVPGWVWRSRGCSSASTPNYTLETASETDTAYTMTAAKSVLLATASETDAAYTMAAAKAVTLATATELATAYDIAATKALLLETTFILFH